MHPRACVRWGDLIGDDHVRADWTTVMIRHGSSCHVASRKPTHLPLVSSVKQTARPPAMGNEPRLPYIGAFPSSRAASPTVSVSDVSNPSCLPPDEIKWPELDAHNNNASTNALVTGADLSRTGSRAGGYAGSIAATSTTELYGAGAGADPYAVPPLPQFNPGQPYRDDPHAFYDPYSGPVPAPFDGAEAIPMTQLAGAGRRSPGPGAAYADYSAPPAAPYVDYGAPVPPGARTGSPAPYGVRAGSPGPGQAYGARSGSPGPGVAYGARAGSPGPGVAYGERARSPGPGAAMAAGQGGRASPAPGGGAYGGGGGYAPR
jgi:hypothetical protein